MQAMRAYRSSLTTYYLLLTTYYLLLTMGLQKLSYYLLLSAYACVTCYSPLTTHYVLLTGDADLQKLAEQAMQHGRRVTRRVGGVIDASSKRQSALPVML